MLKPLPMQHLSLKLLTEDVPQAAQVLAECGVFNPETTDAVAVELPEPLGEEFRQEFHSAKGRLEKIIALMSFQPPETPEFYPVSLAELRTVNTQLGELWSQFSALEEQLHQCTEQQTALKQLLETLQKFADLDVDLSIFQSEKRFLNLHLGTTPAEHFQHLQEAVALAEHFVSMFHRDDNTAYVVVAGPLEHQEQVRGVLEHANFQALSIPPQFHQHPQQVHAELTADLKRLQQNIQEVLKRETELATQRHSWLVKAYHILNRAAAFARLTETSRKRGELALIEGWVPQEQLTNLETLLRRHLERPFVLTTRKPSPAEYPQVPSVTRHPAWLASYMTLVKNYGTPRYGEFDPTLWFATTFVLMFGTMFGDVGHGALIASAGWYWRDKWKTFMPFFLAAGTSSLVFGILYGSVFGFEDLFPALWMSPIHNPEWMLTIALYWGMGFILVATLITIVNRWQEGDYVKALFNTSGVAGILLYLGGFYAIRQWLATDQFDTVQQLAVVLPLSLILGYKWHENQMPVAERILVTLIEGLEAVLNYLANTLSFLRVAAFSLNHVALAIAVFTLADMIGSPTNWLVILLGNLFIVILEGAIVTIQVLRLEYYEGFSRFFSGDGRTFRPLTKGMTLKEN